jgi:hypothetical protein
LDDWRAKRPMIREIIQSAIFPKIMNVTAMSAACRYTLGPITSAVRWIHEIISFLDIANPPELEFG